MSFSNFRMIKSLIFTATTGRSGSVYLENLINENAINAFAEHEPHIIDPDLSSYWFYKNSEKELYNLSLKKLQRLKKGENFFILQKYLINKIPSKYRKIIRKRIPLLPTKEIYVEVDNLFLKSFGSTLYKLFPSMKLIHLTRDPLEVARSIQIRKSYPNKEKPYYLWPEWKKNELILKSKLLNKLNTFQLALWYWFEMELRYSKFIENNNIKKIYEVDIKDLNNPKRVKEMFDFFNITYNKINIDVPKHKGPIKSKINEYYINLTRELLTEIPDWVLERISNNYQLKKIKEN